MNFPQFEKLKGQYVFITNKNDNLTFDGYFKNGIEEKNINFILLDIFSNNESNYS